MQEELKGMLSRYCMPSIQLLGSFTLIVFDKRKNQLLGYLICIVSFIELKRLVCWAKLQFNANFFERIEGSAQEDVDYAQKIGMVGLIVNSKRLIVKGK